VATKLALFLINDVSEHQLLLAADAEQAARRRGFELETHYGEDNVTTQIREMRECIRREEAQRPAAILVFPVRDAAVERVAQEAVAAGVGWIVLNRRADYLAALRAGNPRLAVAAVGPDQPEVGRLQAAQVRALLPAGGHVLAVRGPTMSSGAQDRLVALREGLAGARVNLGEVVGNWGTDEADRAVGGWLEMVIPSGLRPGLVACQNDAMALGARRALERVAGQGNRPELARLPVLGVDGVENAGRKHVDEGRLTATIVLPPSAGPAIDLVARCAKGESIPEKVVLPLSSHPGLETLPTRAPRG
jgi:ribose transport system substrate-binding protein